MKTLSFLSFLIFFFLNTYAPCPPFLGPEFGCPVSGCRAPEKYVGDYSTCLEYSELSCCSPEDDCEVGDFLLVDVNQYYKSEQCQAAFRTLECGYKCHPRQKQYVSTRLNQKNIFRVCQSYCENLWNNCKSSPFVNASLTSTVEEVFKTWDSFCVQQAAGRMDVSVVIDPDNHECFRGEPQADPKYSYATDFRPALTHDTATFLVHAVTDIGLPANKGGDIGLTVAFFPPVNHQQVLDQGDGTYVVTYSTETAGTYEIVPMIRGEPLASGPYSAFVANHTFCPIQTREAAKARPPLSFCTYYGEHSCCNRTDTDEMIMSEWWDGIRAIYGTNHQCVKRFEELYCGLRCAPTQQFTFIDQTGPRPNVTTPPPTSPQRHPTLGGVKGIWRVCDCFCFDLYDACKDVKLMTGLTVGNQYQHSPLSFCMANNPWEGDVTMEFIAPERARCFGSNGRGEDAFGPTTFLHNNDNCIVAGGNGNLAVQTVDAYLTPLDQSPRVRGVYTIVNQLVSVFRFESDAFPQQVNVTNFHDGTYDIQYNLTKAGDWRGFTYIMDNDAIRTQNSPFWVTVRPGKAEQVQIPDMKLALSIGENVHFLMEAHDHFGNRLYSGGDNFLALVTGPEFTPLNMVDNCDGTYDILFTPKQPGNYTLTISLDEKVVAQYNITAGLHGWGLADYNSYAFGPGVDPKVSYGQEVCFWIISRDILGNIVTAGGPVFDVHFVDPEGNPLLDISEGSGMEDLHNGTYSVCYTPRWVGYFYTYVVVRSTDYNIIASPFKTESIGPNDCGVPCDHGICVEGACQCFWDSCGIEKWTGPSCSIPPRPQFCWIRFADHGSAVEVLFNTQTNRAGLTGEWNCSSLFTGKLDYLGTEERFCAWHNNSMVNIFLGSKASAVPNVHQLHLNTTVLGSAWDSKILAISNNRNTIRGPKNRPKPKIVLSAPTLVGACSDVILDASKSTGTGGRLMSWEWSILPVTGEATPSDFLTIRQYLSVQNYSVVKLSNLILRPQYNYHIAVRAINFFGRSSDLFHWTFFVANYPTPAVIIHPSHLKIPAWREVSLGSEVSLAGCPVEDAVRPDTPAEEEWTYSWIRTSGPLFQVDLETADQKNLFIPKNTFLSGNTYTLQLKATHKRLKWLAGLSKITIEIELTSPLLTLDGGVSTRSYELNPVPLLLDASDSRTRDSPLEAPLNYAWGCEKIGDPGPLTAFKMSPRPCFDSDSISSYLPNSPMIFLDAGSLGLDTFKFNLNSFVSAGRPVSNASEIIHTGSGGPSVLIESFGSTSDQIAAHSSQLVLLGSINTDEDQVTWVWEVLTKNLLLNNRTFVKAPEAVVHGSNPYRLAYQNLIINQNILGSGEEYKFRLNATLATGESGFAEISFVTNKRPHSGNCDVTPGEGYATSTTFTIKCVNWEDTETDQPLMYQFGLDIRGTTTFLTPKSFLNKFTTLLPEGQNTTKIVVRVFDQDGAFTNVVIPVMDMGEGKLFVQDYADPNPPELVEGKRDTEATEADRIFELGSPEAKATALLVKIYQGISRSETFQVASLILMDTDLLNNSPNLDADSVATRTELRTTLMNIVYSDWVTPETPAVLKMKLQIISEITKKPEEITGTAKTQGCQLIYDITKMELEASESTAYSLYRAISNLYQSNRGQTSSQEQFWLRRSFDNAVPLVLSYTISSDNRQAFEIEGVTVRIFKTPLDEIRKQGTVSGNGVIFTPSDNAWSDLERAGYSVIAYQLIEFDSNVYSWHESSKGISSVTSSLAFYDEYGNPLDIQSDFKITFTGQFEGVKNSTCYWWDTALGQFHDRGCKATGSGVDFFSCTCSRVRESIDYAVLFDVKAVGPSGVIPDGLGVGESLPEAPAENPDAFLETQQIILIVITGAVFIAILIAIFFYNQKETDPRGDELRRIAEAVRNARRDAIPDFFLDSDNEDLLELYGLKKADAASSGSQEFEDSETRRRRREDRTSTRLQRMTEESESSSGPQRLKQESQQEWAKRYQSTRTHRPAFTADSSSTYSDTTPESAPDAAPMRRYAPKIQREVIPASSPSSTSRTNVEIPVDE